MDGFRALVRQWLADNLVGEFATLRGVGGPGREHEDYEQRPRSTPAGRTRSAAM